MTRVLIVVLLFSVCFTATAQGAPPVTVARKPSLTCPQTEIGIPDLQARYTEMWGRYSANVEGTTRGLQAALEKHAKSATASGNLDLTLFWKGLAKQYDQTGELQWDDPSQKKSWSDRFGGTSFPEDFVVAVKKASKAYSLATIELEKHYGELVAELTKAEKLEEAVKVRGEIKELLAGKSSAPQSTPEPKTKPRPVEKPAPVSPIVGMWINGKGWGNEFLADKTARNLNPKGEVDTVGTWKEEGQGRYSAQLASWQWQIVLRGDEIEIVRFHNGEAKWHETLKRRR